MGGSCGCKCSSCCAACFSTGCGGACCPCPASEATCGCGNDILSGETCLNDTYYLSWAYPGSPTEGAYVYFKFGYCLATASSSISHTDAIKNFMMWFYNQALNSTGYTSSWFASNSTLSTTKPNTDIYGDITSASPGYTTTFNATNAYLWSDYCTTELADFSNYTCYNDGAQGTYQPGGWPLSAYDLPSCSSDIPSFTAFVQKGCT